MNSQNITYVYPNSGETISTEAVTTTQDRFSDAKIVSDAALVAANTALTALQESVSSATITALEIDAPTLTFDDSVTLSDYDLGDIDLGDVPDKPEFDDEIPEYTSPELGDNDIEAPTYSGGGDYIPPSFNVNTDQLDNLDVAYRGRTDYFINPIDNIDPIESISVDAGLLNIDPINISSLDIGSLDITIPTTTMGDIKSDIKISDPGTLVLTGANIKVSGLEDIKPTTLDVSFDDVIVNPSKISMNLRDMPSVISITKPIIEKFNDVIRIDNIPQVPFIDTSIITDPVDPVNIDEYLDKIENIINNTNIDYSEDIYDEYYMGMIKDKIMQGVLSGIVMDPVVEDAMFTRSNERRNIANIRARQKVSDEWAARGMPMPDGIIAANIASIDAEYQAQSLENDLSILIEVYKINNENIKFAIEAGLKAETICRDFFNNIMNRRLDYAKAKVGLYMQLADTYMKFATLHNQVYLAMIGFQEAKARLLQVKAEIVVRAFEAQITAYKAKIDANLEAFKTHAQITIMTNNANLDYEKLLVQLNTLQIEGVSKYNEGIIEKAKAEGTIQAQYYQALIAAMSAKAEVIKGKVDMYVEELKGKIAVVNAKNQTVLDNARLQAEIYKVESEAKIEEYKSKASVIGIKADADVKLYTAKTNAVIEEYKAKSMTNITSAEIRSKIFNNISQAKIEAYKADITGQLGVIDANVKVATTNASIATDIAKANMSGNIATVEANSKISIANSNAEMEIIKAQVSLDTALLDAKVKAALGKVGAMTEAIKANVAAYTAGIDASSKSYIANVNANTEVYKANISKYMALKDAEVKIFSTSVGAEIDIYKAKIAAKDSISNYILKTYQTSIEGILGKAKLKESEISIKADIVKSQILANVEANKIIVQKALGQFDAEIKKYEVDIRHGDNIAALATEATKATAQISAQIAAGALSGISASAHIGTTFGLNVSSGSQANENWTHYSDESKV